MAHSTSNKVRSNTPSFIAWSVTKNGEKESWTRVGAAWSHNDQQGMTLQLDAIPFGGRIVLRVPAEGDKTKESR